MRRGVRAALALSVAFGVATLESGCRRRPRSVSGEEVDHPDWIGRAAPALAFPAVNGEALRLEQFRGRPTVVIFWATWCAACRRELPHLNRLAREVPGVAVLGLSTEPEETVRAFVKTHPFDFPVASVPKPPAPFDGVRAIPTNVFIDRKGIIREVRVASLPWEELRPRADAPDYVPGRPTPNPRTAAAGPTRTLAERWSASLSDVSSLAVCDWNGDGTPEIAAASGETLHVLDGAGAEVARVGLPDQGSRVDCTSVPGGGVRVLAYETWSPKVEVRDGLGKTLWSYPAKAGIDGAHWGDLDGDGTPEMIVGMNGRYGLHAVSIDGKPVWQVPELENVWNQAVVPGRDAAATRVVATEQGGHVVVIDGRGRKLASYQPLDQYFSPLAAARLPGGGTQLLVASETRAVALDLDGRVSWSAGLPRRPRGTWSWPLFASGDLTGDGTPEWVFATHDAPRVLEVRSTDGTAVARLELAAAEKVFEILPQKDRALLVVASDRLRAYAVE
jgi:peroxiredoxin